MKEVASIIGEALRAPEDEAMKDACRARVSELRGVSYPG